MLLISRVIFPVNKNTVTMEMKKKNGHWDLLLWMQTKLVLPNRAVPDRTEAPAAVEPPL